MKKESTEKKDEALETVQKAKAPETDQKVEAMEIETKIKAVETDQNDKDVETDQNDKDDDATFFSSKINKNPLDKYATALVANCLLSEGDSIVIDAGTSLTPIAQIIQIRALNTPKEMHYSIMTHNRTAFDILITSNLKAHFNIFHTGGRYDEDLNASFGWLAENAYQNFFAKWVFIGQAGVVAHEGLFCHGNTEELSLKKTIFRKSGYARVILSDSSKLGIPAGLCFGEADKLKDNVDFCILLITIDSDSELVDSERIERELQILENRYKVNVVTIDYDHETDINRNEIIKLDGDKVDKLNKQFDGKLHIELESAELTLTPSMEDNSYIKYEVVDCKIIKKSRQ